VRTAPPWCDVCQARPRTSQPPKLVGVRGSRIFDRAGRSAVENPMRPRRHRFADSPTDVQTVTCEVSAYWWDKQSGLKPYGSSQMFLVDLGELVTMSEQHVNGDPNERVISDSGGRLPRRTRLACLAGELTS